MYLYSLPGRNGGMNKAYKSKRMSDLSWKKISSEYLSNHIYFTARRDVCQRQDGTIIDPYFVVEIPRSATALAITEDNKVLLVRQYRHPLERTLIETPGGFIDEGEDFADGMRRELLEETGYEFKDIEHLAEVAANPGILSGYTDLFLATGGKKKGKQQLDHNEEIEVIEVEIDDLISMVMTNRILQSLHVNCIFYALLKLKKLKLIDAGPGNLL